MGCCESNSKPLTTLNNRYQTGNPGNFNMSSYQNNSNNVLRFPQGKALLLKRVKQ